jgi:hypothetical protein
MKIDIIMDTVREAFSNYPDPNRPDEEILELLEITLKNNDFEFFGRIFLQIVGMAMGKAYAPNLADLYMARFDKKAKYDFRIKPEDYFRFLDDLYMLWPGTREDLQEYETFLNSIIPGIKITLNARDSIIEFLDTRIYKFQLHDGSWVLKTMVYFKPTDTHQLLHRRSYHPRHTCLGVLKSQFIRFKRISSSRSDYDDACKTLWKVLKDRAYDQAVYRKMKADIWLNYNTNRKQDKQPDSDIIPVITYYDGINCKVNQLAKRAILKNPILGLYRTISAYRIHRNLQKHLIKNK